MQYYNTYHITPVIIVVVIILALATLLPLGLYMEEKHPEAISRHTYELLDYDCEDAKCKFYETGKYCHDCYALFQLDDGVMLMKEYTFHLGSYSIESTKRFEHLSGFCLLESGEYVECCGYNCATHDWFWGLLVVYCVTIVFTFSAETYYLVKKDREYIEEVNRRSQLENKEGYTKV